MRSRGMSDALATHVLNDSDHSDPFIITTARVLALKPFSDWVFTRPVPLRHRFVDDSHRWSVSMILLRKEAPSDEGGPKGLEKVSAHSRPGERTPITRQLNFSSFDTSQPEVYG